MHYMFHYASAFSQNLNWCVGDDELDEAFSGSCAADAVRRPAGCCRQLRAVARADYDRPHDQCRPYDGRLPIVMNPTTRAARSASKPGARSTTSCASRAAKYVPLHGREQLSAGFDIWVPRNYEHLQGGLQPQGMGPHEDWRAYEMMTPVGVYRDENGWPCHDYAMNSARWPATLVSLAECRWRSVVPAVDERLGSLGRVQAGCWLGVHGHWDQGLALYTALQ